MVLLYLNFYEFNMKARKIREKSAVDKNSFALAYCVKLIANKCEISSHVLLKILNNALLLTIATLMDITNN